MPRALAVIAIVLTLVSAVATQSTIPPPPPGMTPEAWAAAIKGDTDPESAYTIFSAYNRVMSGQELDPVTWEKIKVLANRPKYGWGPWTVTGYKWMFAAQVMIAHENLGKEKARQQILIDQAAQINQLKAELAQLQTSQKILMQRLEVFEQKHKPLTP